MEEYCRICVRKCRKHKNLFSQNVKHGMTWAEMIFICTKMRFREGELYTEICCGCSSLLETVFRFHQLLANSEFKINQLKISSEMVQVTEFHNVDEGMEYSENDTAHTIVNGIDAHTELEIDFNIKRHIDRDGQFRTNLLDTYRKDESCADPNQIPVPKRIEASEAERKNIEQPNKSAIGAKKMFDDKTFECYKCKVKLRSYWATNLHLRQHDAAAKYKCVVCSEQFMKLSSFNRHLCKGTEIKCDYCFDIFSATSTLIKHMDEAHEEKKYHRCSKCSTYYAMPLLLEYHQSIHPICSHEVDEAEMEFVCKVCNKRFKKFHLLNQHLLIHSDNRPFLCPECGKGFKTTSSLATHRLGHRERTIKCPDCPKTFNRLTNFNKHKDIHSNVKYICELCQAELQSRYAHRAHLRKHRLTEDDKRHKCEYCPRRFYKKGKLIQHVRTHTGEKPYRCGYCDRAYAQKCDLNKHLRKHLGDKIYTCDMCTESFKFYKDQQKHIMDCYKLQKMQNELNSAQNIKEIQ